MTISQPFYLGKYRVTQAQWQAVMGRNPLYFDDCSTDRDCTVDTISWEDAQVFIEELNRREGANVYRLPTEAEWEHVMLGDLMDWEYAYYGMIYYEINGRDRVFRGGSWGRLVCRLGVGV